MNLKCSAYSAQRTDWHWHQRALRSSAGATTQLDCTSSVEPKGPQPPVRSPRGGRGSRGSEPLVQLCSRGSDSAAITKNVGASLLFVVNDTHDKRLMTRTNNNTNLLKASGCWTSMCSHVRCRIYQQSEQAHLGARWPMSGSRSQAAPGQAHEGAARQRACRCAGVQQC
jgi:hypothetical protein